MNNLIFDEDSLYYSILSNSNEILKRLNSEPDSEDVKEEKKKVNRIYGNAFSLFLMNGYKCKLITDNNQKFYEMQINNEEFKCDEANLKNILFHNFDDIIQKSLI